MSSDARSMARRYYEGAGRRLEADMAALATNPNGVVVFLPRLVALMKPVHAGNPDEWLTLASSPPGADAWYVHLLAGDLAWARRIGRELPVYPWLCFQRGARNATLHRVSWARFVRKGLSVPTKKESSTMGFKKMLGVSSPPSVNTPPPTVAETLDTDIQADYAQRASHKRGLLSTILSNRNRAATADSRSNGGHTTLG